MSLTGNVELDGVNLSVEASVYIETPNIVEFTGGVDITGIINGSVINYSNESMMLSGNSDLYFNRSGTTESPAGFVPEIILKYDPSSYTEVTL